MLGENRTDGDTIVYWKKKRMKEMKIMTNTNVIVLLFMLGFN